MRSTLLTAGGEPAPLLHSDAGAAGSREDSPPLIGVLPATALRSRGRLFSALERAVDVRFVPGEGGDLGGVDAALLFPGEEPDVAGLPERLPRHAMALGERESDSVTVSISNNRALPAAVQGQLLTEANAPFLAESQPQYPGAPREPAAEVLARAEGLPLWERHPGPLHTRSLLAPAELGAAEPLRERLRSGRFLGLLPLFWFLRSLYAGAQWQPPEPRASFIFDDPNLHALTYGFIDFRELAAWTRRRATHVAFAMVPLDGRLVARRVVELFRREPGLSLMVHGNNHLRWELERAWSPEQRLAMLDQALERLESFERRTGVAVSRVMTPPHGRCAEASAVAMRSLGYEALCVSRPYPWLDEPPPERPLAGWGVSEIVAGGLPVLPRLAVSADPSEFVFRALLGQPLIVYGHHGDVSQGLDALGEHADSINRLGDVRWCSPGEIARSNYSTRVIPGGLELRPYSRLVELVIPSGCSTLRISPPAEGLDMLDHPVRWRRSEDERASWNALSISQGVSVEPGDRLQIALGRPPVRGVARPARLLAAQAVARRAATELRDRLQPIGRRAHLYR